jgi:uncharacterized protein YdeI (YjbR/CyaY-like superfamily)
MSDPRFFKTSKHFRDWLDTHAAAELELLVGFYKVDSGRPSMTWPESVDEALCYGWIDGVRKRVDDTAYTIRFTPRKTTSIWSAININKVKDLQQQAKSRIYAFEQAESAELSAEELIAFKREKAAWAYFEACPPGYKKQMIHRITTVKRLETRAVRFAKLVEACKMGERIK